MTETEISLERKLKILADAAKYDVACTSSGSSRRGKKGHLGNTVSAGICHTFSSDGRCVSLLKIFLVMIVFLTASIVRVVLQNEKKSNIYPGRDLQACGGVLSSELY